MKRRLALLLALSAVAFVSPLDPGYAVEVEAFVPGLNAGTDPEMALGAPTGGGMTQGSLDTYSLGTGGSLTLHMEPPLLDGPGADLLVCENAFYVTGTLQSFAETAFVEVSTDGSHFARFPTSYTGPDEPLPTFTGLHPARFRGFAGAMPVNAHPPGVDPLDLTAAGGDAFDLAELEGHPLVLAEQLDLADIRYVRLIDVEAGVSGDTAGHIVYDAGVGNGSSADIDAVVGLNTTENQAGGRPRVETDLVNGFLVIKLEDLNGLVDIKPGITLSVNGYPAPFGLLLPFFQFTFLSQTKVELTSLGPIPPGMFQAVLRVGLRDTLGMRGGDSVTIQ